jgi:hypothetical protein
MLITKIHESSPNIFRKDTIFTEDTIKGKKAIKNESINNAYVTYNGMEFDADEVSLNRMSRYITLAHALFAKSISSGQEPESAYQQHFMAEIDWKLRDNSIQTITIDQLLNVFEMSVANMSTIWLGQ